MLADWLGADSAKLYRRLLDVVYGSGANPPPDSRVDFENTHFDGVPVRVYRPKTGGGEGRDEGGEGLLLLPAVVIYHGGGWTIGSVGMCICIEFNNHKNIYILVKKFDIICRIN